MQSKYMLHLLNNTWYDTIVHICNNVYSRLCIFASMHYWDPDSSGSWPRQNLHPGPEQLMNTCISYNCHYHSLLPSLNSHSENSLRLISNWYQRSILITAGHKLLSTYFFHKTNFFFVHFTLVYDVSGFIKRL